ncbi:hypothetical protein [Subtercola boreus]|uniref:hypothetical protein n=1 Tax=Subtercola boreus TaxID=120213 RepID=UPI0011C04DC2|nr:hypothetical protein [Subtercola boreus]
MAFSFGVLGMHLINRGLDRGLVPVRPTSFFGFPFEAACFPFSLGLDGAEVCFFGERWCVRIDRASDLPREICDRVTLVCGVDDADPGCDVAAVDGVDERRNRPPVRIDLALLEHLTHPPDMPAITQPPHPRNQLSSEPLQLQ